MHFFISYTVRSPLTEKVSRLSFLFAVFAVIVAIITCAVATGGGPIFATLLFPSIALIGIHFIPKMEADAPIIFILYPFFAVLGGAPFGAFLGVAPAAASIPMACVILTSAATILFLSNRIDLRTDRELLIYGQIAAFKTFLLDAEADRINTLVEENPNYYYDVLPYCYILKITDKLKAKFDRIALDGPSRYLGDLRNTLMF